MGCGASNDQAANSIPIVNSSLAREKESAVLIAVNDPQSKQNAVIDKTETSSVMNSLSKLGRENAKLSPFISLINTGLEPFRQSTPAALCACSLSFLIKWATAAPDTHTTADVCYSVVKPITQMAECRLTDTMHPSDVGPPNFFVSHRWGMSFQELIANVRDQLPGADTDKVFCWVDM
jgi:hypothetical protein